MLLGDIIGKARTLAEQFRIPESDFIYVICAQLGCSSVELMLKRHVAVSIDDEEALANAFNRLVKHEPPQYISGKAAFYHQYLDVDPRVLIPRSETEGLVELALHHLSDGMKVLEIGTGSGAIAIALQNVKPSLRIVATDISESALEVAKSNAKLCKAEIEFAQADLFPSLPGEFDAIISNPPYISADEMRQLEPKVSDFEPHLALYGGIDGLDFYRRILERAGKYLAPKGFIAFEHGAYQRDAIQHIAKAYGWQHIETHRDLQGRDRYTLVFAPRTTE